MAATHWTDVGFDVTKWKDVQKVVARAAELGDRIEVPGGSYVVWTVGAGIEVWVQVGPDDRTLGCHPHLRGEGRMRASVARALPNDENPLDGTLLCWADPQTEDLEAGLYPFVATAPDFALVRDLEMPRLASVQVAAFAHDARCVASEQDYQPEAGLWGPQAFIPTGVVEVKGLRRTPRIRAVPLPEAILSAKIETVERRTNPAGDGEFWAIRARTLGGTLDVAADPEALEGEPVPGGVIEGEFWLSASLGDEI